MKTLGRLQVAVALALFAAIGVAGTAAGAIAFWDRWPLTYNLITVFVTLLFMVPLGIGLSIGIDRRLDDVPWGRLGFYLIFMILAGGVLWVRDMIQGG